MLCPKCGSANPNDKGFCGVCGAILDTHLTPLVTAIVDIYLKEKLKDRKLVETEIAESVVSRIQNWTKLVLYPATGLLAMLTVILTVLGFSTFQQIKDQRDTVTKEANAAEAEVKNVSGRLDKARADLDAAQKQVHAKSSEVDQATKDAISKVNQDLSALGEDLKGATGENPYEAFTVSEGDDNGRVSTGPRGDTVDGVTGYLLLKKTPLHQSIQIYLDNQRLLPRWTYKFEKNILIIGLRRSDSGDAIKHYIQVGYVADKGSDTTFHQLVKRNGVVFGDGITELPRFKAPQYR